MGSTYLGGNQWFCGQFLLLYAYTQMPKGILYVLSILAKIQSKSRVHPRYFFSEWSVDMKSVVKHLPPKSGHGDVGFSWTNIRARAHI